MIPKPFFWLLDGLTLLVSFLLAHIMVPYLRPLPTSPSTGPWTPWVGVIFSPYTQPSPLPPILDLLWILAVTGPAVFLGVAIARGYGSLFALSRARILFASCFAAVAGLSLVALVMLAFNSPDWSRLFLFLFATLTAAGLSCHRLGLRSYVRHRRDTGRYAKNVALIGSQRAVEHLVQYFAENVPASEYALLGFLRFTSNNLSNEDDSTTSPQRIRSLGRVGELGDLLIHRPIHEVVVIYPSDGGTWLKQVIRDCDYFGVTLRILPEALLFEGPKELKSLYRGGPFRLPMIVLATRHMDSEALFIKRILDLTVSALLLAILSPLLTIIAAAIKLTTPGLPVFYLWHVVGRNGVEFTGYKFTTMFADADQRRSELLHQNEMNGPVFKIKDDPRITPLGRLLRKFSLNELPQLWSVLKGDMSLVGPRPAFRHELERYEFWHKRKLSIVPGMTCLWQVSGRNKINNFDDWVKMDLEYIDNWSLWLDVKILIRTGWAVLAGTGS